MTSSASSSSPRARALRADRRARRTRSPSSCREASRRPSSSWNEALMRGVPLSESAGDVALGPFVGRLGEDLLGRVVLDEDPVPAAVLLHLEAEEGGHL